MPAPRVFAGIAIVCCAPGCSAFASSSDRLPAGESARSPASAGACRQGLSTPSCPTVPAFAAASSTPPLATLQDAAASGAGTWDAGSLRDAAMEGGDGSEAGAARACAGPGEFSDATGATCYLYDGQPAPWAAARGACVIWGGDLARIESSDEDLLLASYLLADAWIGASDLSEEGAFTWTDRTALTFSNWADAQPDDFGGVEDCVELLLRDGAWNDQQCTEPKTYFCERPLE